MPTLSVAVITLNEEDRLPKLLGSLKGFADEVVVVDSGSTDRTVEIAKSYGAKVFVEDWKGYGKQKQSAFEKTTGEWVFFLDADEVPTEGLKRAIRRAIENPSADGYYIKRRAVYLGKPMRFLWANEWLLRLVKRSANPRWVGNVHETLKVEGKTEKLKGGELLHYTYRDLFDHFQKTVKYAKLSAREYYERGKRPSVFNIAFNPLWAFLRTYLFKLGFLEGYRGLLIAFGYSFGTFLKYAFLWELKNQGRTS